MPAWTAPKPRTDLQGLRILSDGGPHGTAHVSVGGLQGAVTREADPNPHRRGPWARDMFTWTCEYASGATYSAADALQALLIEALRVSPEPDPVELLPRTRVALDVLNGDPKATIRMLREVLLARTGIRWSARRNGHTVTISSMPKRRIDGRMRVADAAMLAVLCGRTKVLNRATGVQVDCRTQATPMAYMLAGHPLPPVRLVAAS